MVSNGTLCAALTETHLNSNVVDAEINMEGYVIYRADRANDRMKGGAAIYLKDELSASTSLICADSNGVVEYLMIYIKELKMVVINVYRPPTASTMDFVPVMDSLREKFLALNDTSLTLFVCGDFNMPRTDWDVGQTVGATGEERRQASHLLAFRDDLLLNQIIEVPTRERNILDLVFTNDVDMVMKVDVEDSIMTDHRIILVSLMTGSEVSPGRRPQTRDGLNNRNFYHSSTDWDKMVAELAAVSWSEVFRGLDLDDKYHAFIEKVEDICTRFTPPRSGSGKGYKRIPRDRRILMKKRAKLNKRLLNSRGDTERDRIKAIIKEIQVKLSESHMDELKRNESEAVQAIKENVKYFYQYAKKRSKLKVSIGPLEDDNALTTDPARMCELLKSHYESVYTSPLSGEDLEAVKAETTVPTEFKLEDIEFTKEDFVEAAKSLRYNSAAGPDGVPAVLIKKAIKVLAEPLFLIWRESMRLGKIPKLLKKGRITPIYKGGNRAKRQNYRGVALTSHCIKLFEKIIVKRMIEYMEEYNLYNEGQHGFRAGRSCLSQLLDHYQNILESMSNGEDVDVVYLDFAKAFDKVDHCVLLEKLKRIGITGSVLKWIEDFLRNRTQQVTVEGATSSESIVVSGVPQGSVLGPLLFLIHIGDMTDTIQHSRASSFADDTRVLRPVSSVQDCELLQSDLQRIYDWAKQSNMSFNGNKFELLRYSVKSDTIPYVYMSSESTAIPEKDKTTDLGVIMSSSAEFKDNVSHVAARGRQQMGWVLRIFITRERRPLMTLYRAVVLPILEYCCQLWCPTSVGMIREIEAVQRTFTSRIAGFEHLDYWERLRKLKLYSLERRRERYIIIYIWKIIQGMSPNFDAGTRIETVSSDRRGRLCRIPSRVRTRQRVETLRENSFPILGPRLFNCLPKEIRAYDGGLDGFKGRLDRVLAAVPDKPCLAHYYQAAVNNSLVEQIRQPGAEAAVN